MSLLTDSALFFKRSMCKVVGKNRMALEIGCGDGILSLAFAFQGNKVIGTDISDLCVSIADMKRACARFVKNMLRKFSGI